ncbi:hypothetical protein B0T26DRAFT_800708 [Lasiosphaeria miniovina]|uniref:Uncharacterized protein n=1 Tax=Lasiosphaeria miniovina TaxID=1954250 RepID=A0AA40ATL8_9PEZI|nr:uncharacterized protein B0T26DRAFT_800708 [Lasiosphaeria miniovina]KAK0721801.1 hypothetical protein B0T26DRAFT_800708 [Lasiosphaeria miniovina]
MNTSKASRAALNPLLLPGIRDKPKRRPDEFSAMLQHYLNEKPTLVEAMAMGREPIAEKDRVASHFIKVAMPAASINKPSQFMVGLLVVTLLARFLHLISIPAAATTPEAELAGAAYQAQFVMSASSSSSQLPDISNALVTAANPARSGGEHPALNHVRSAALHNYIVEYGWLASGRSLDDLPRNRSFFDRYGDEAGALRGRLSPSVTAFLDSITIVDGVDIPFFFWVSGISEPSELFQASDLLFEEQDCVFGEAGDAALNATNSGPRFLTLYPTLSGMTSKPAGLVYDQRRHVAVVALDMFDLDFCTRQGDDLQLVIIEDLWYPLETVLTNWIHLIHIGKVAAVAPDVDDHQALGEKIGPWAWRTYSAAQVRRPHFRTIAPGLLVPLDAAAFAASQTFTTTEKANNNNDDDDEDEKNAQTEPGDPVIPPVLIFQAADGRTAHLGWKKSRYEAVSPFHPREFALRDDQRVPAGLYSESVSRPQPDGAEEGFRLVLPFAVGAPHGSGWEASARKSGGERLEHWTLADLFQHGFKPFGGEPWRAQRLERLLGRWRELVEDGVWTVGPGGVEGSIDTFKDANYGEQWRDYWIAPTW